MADLGVRYMGLNLSNPLVASSSGLTREVDGVKRLEDAGIGAVVLQSIFEEQVMDDVCGMMGPESAIPEHPEAAAYICSYGTQHASEEYLSLIRKARAAVDIPVIASLHCVTAGQWVDYARRVADAGASAIELNVFIPPQDPGMDGRAIENVYLDIAKKVKAAVCIPVAMKIGWHFSGMARFLVDLSERVDAMVLFNRYYRMNIDIEEMKLVHAKPFSEPREYENSLRWISVMNKVARCDLASSSGVHDWESAVRLMLVGASAVEVCSKLYQDGLSSVGSMKSDMSDWMDRHGFKHVEDFRGSMSRRVLNRPAQFDRVQFMKFTVDAVHSGMTKPLE